MAFWRDIYERLRYDWRLHYLLPVLLLLPLLVIFSLDPFDSASERGRPVMARITCLGSSATRYQGPPPGVQVCAMSAQGAAGTRLVPPSFVAGCSIGDSIAAEQKGMRLYLKPKPCGH